MQSRARSETESGKGRWTHPCGSLLSRSFFHLGLTQTPCPSYLELPPLLPAARSGIIARRCLVSPPSLCRLSCGIFVGLAQIQRTDALFTHHPWARALNRHELLSIDLTWKTHHFPHRQHLVHDNGILHELRRKQIPLAGGNRLH